MKIKYTNHLSSERSNLMNKMNFKFDILLHYSMYQQLKILALEKNCFLFNFLLNVIDDRMVILF